MGIRIPIRYLLIVGLGLAIFFLYFYQPKSKPINPDLIELSKHIESPLVATILIESEKLPIQEEVVKELKIKIDSLGSELVSKSEYQRSEDQNFLRKRLPLFLSLEDLKKVHTYLKEAIQFEKDLYNPFSIFNKKQIKEPSFDAESLADNLISNRPYKMFPGGNYSTEDKKKWAVLIYGTSGFKENAHKLYSYLNRLVEENKNTNVKMSVVHSEDSALKEIFKYSPASLTVFTKDREESNKIATSIRAKCKECTVRTIESYVPNDQLDKTKVLRSVKKLLTPTIIKFLDETEKKWAKGFLSLEVFEPFEEKDLPASIRSPFTDRTENKGNILYVESSPEEKSEIQTTLKSSNPDLVVLDPVY